MMPENSSSKNGHDALGWNSKAGRPSPPSVDRKTEIDPDIDSIISSLSATSNGNNKNSTSISMQVPAQTSYTDHASGFYEGRRSSLTGSAAGSDVDSEFAFGFKRGTLSLGGHNSAVNGGATGNRIQTNLFSSASISGGVPSNSKPSGSGRFLEKFSAVAEATREVELLGTGLGSLSIGSASGRVPSSRRQSFLTETKPFQDTNGSLNESLSNPLKPTTSGRQSISERIDNYLSNSSSPNQSFNNGTLNKTRTLSISSDVNNKSESNSLVFDPNEKVHNIWNQASAASAVPFTPMFNQSSQQHQSSQGYPQLLPYGFPFNQPFPVLSMMPPPFLNSQGQQNGSAISTPSGFNQQQPLPRHPIDSGNKDSTLLESSTKTDSNVASNEKQSDYKEPTATIPLQAPQPGFSPNTPGFIYPQAFPPYAFLAPQMSPDPSQFDHHRHTPPAAHNQNNATNHPQQKRNGRSPKSTSPNSHNQRSNGKGSKNHIYRSPLLEEFRNNSTDKEYKLKDIFGSAVEFSKDQHGSRFIQQQLEGSSFAEKEVIFNEIRESALELMTDVFGNYVIQKFFEHGSETQKKVLLDEMKNNIQSLSLQMYGCRVVQRAIEYVDVENQIFIINELQDSILLCIKDQNGNHVIQKSIEKIPIDRIGFILDSLKTQIYHLSTHPYGCRVIQRLLEYSNKDDEKFILDELNKFTYFLIQDQYGNYVIQHIIEHGEINDRKVIVDTVLGSVVEFSKHKFASNVVEKCVIYGNETQRNAILDEVLAENDVDDESVVDDRSPLGLMMKDQFANYVVQKLVDVSKGLRKKILVKKIKQYLRQISKSSYGKHLASIEKLIVLSETAITSDDEE